MKCFSTALLVALLQQQTTQGFVSLSAVSRTAVAQHCPLCVSTTELTAESLGQAAGDNDENTAEKPSAVDIALPVVEFSSDAATATASSSDDQAQESSAAAVNNHEVERHTMFIGNLPFGTLSFLGFG